jgi:protein Tex
MIEFSKQIAEKWNIPVAIAERVCNSYLKGDSPYYLSEYDVELSSEVASSVLWEIFDFLKYLDELASKKKRVLNAYVKLNLTTPELEKRINLTTSTFELDDLLIPVRPNARSRGQLALNKGLKSLADDFFNQKEETISVEERIAEFVEKNPSIKNSDEAIQGVKDIIAETIAYDETSRAMAREFAFEDGFFEIIPKNKKDPLFTNYIDRSIPINELSNEELLQFFIAEDNKTIRFKLGVQLFRITELLRHHVITNPDATSFDLLCETIDDCWLRLLQPIIERDVKTRLRENAERWATRQIAVDFEKLFLKEISSDPLLVIDGSNVKHFQFIAIRSTGELLGTTTERKSPDGKLVVSERLKQFLARYRTNNIIVIDNEYAEQASALLQQAISGWDITPEIIRYTPEAVATKSATCDWIIKEFDSLLDDTMKKLYADAIKYLHPISLLPKVGLHFYSVHPLQQLVPPDRLLEIIDRIQTGIRLKIGLPLKEIGDSPIKKISSINEKQILAIKAADSEGQIATKNDILKVPGITEVAFRNVAGFLLIPGAENLLDRTVVHPDFFDWFNEIAVQLNVSVESIVTEPEYLHSFVTDSASRKAFIAQHLINHLAAARRFVLQPTTKVRRKLKLTEVQEGTVVSGRVTNITQFGVFVNINAVCDGLIHISQLADEYVETPDQVVSVNDRVDVRILKVDVKKRRISLSMRNLGTMAPKVRPSKGQLDNLAEFFKNR